MARISVRALMAMAVLAGVSGVTLADIIELSDGRKISGSISSQGDTSTIKGDDGSLTTVPRSQVARITLTSTVTPAQAADAEWIRLTPLIKKADDIQTVISLHEGFLKKFPDTPRSAQVSDSLATYKKLAEGDAVKFRGRWMARTQIDVTLKQWAEDARPALDLYRAGNMKDALDAVKAILTADDQNPDALTIAGLAAYRGGNVTQARTYFTQLAAADPTSVLAENNLAVISYLQKQPGEGIIHYTKALQIKTDNRLLLDNIAEAIFAFTGDKNSAIYRALSRQYDAAETAMEAKMAKDGLVRWGSTWVTKDQLEQLKRYQNAAQDQAAQLDAQYRSSQQALAALDAQSRQAQADIDARTNDVNSYYSQILFQQTHPTNNMNIALLIQERDMANDLLNRAISQKVQVDSQRAQLVASLQDMESQAQKVRDTVAGAGIQYTGVQRIMDVGEGENPPPPATVTNGADGNGPPTIVISVPGPVPPAAYAPAPMLTPMLSPGVVIITGPGPGGPGGPGGGPRGRGPNGPPTTHPTTVPASMPTTRPAVPVTPTTRSWRGSTDTQPG